MIKHEHLRLKQKLLEIKKSQKWLADKIAELNYDRLLLYTSGYRVMPNNIEEKCWKLIRSEEHFQKELKERASEES